MNQTIKIALFASGNGTNVQQISDYFLHRSHLHPEVDIVVDCVIYNRKDAFVAERAKTLGIESFYINRTNFLQGETTLELLKKRNVDYIILAGFLLLIPEYLLEAFPNRIINIHPALLPSYGGKGMYGHHVHEAVIANGEEESGITIHLVDNQFDHGRMLFQAKVQISKEDTADSLAEKIHLLEKTHFPLVIENYILDNINK